MRRGLSADLSTSSERISERDAFGRKTRDRMNTACILRSRNAANEGVPPEGRREQVLRSALSWPLVLIGCASSPAPPPRSELIVDEPTVVRAALRRGDQVHVPPLVPPLEQASPAFQRGYDLSWELLAAEGPPAPPQTDKAAYDAWLGDRFEPWFAQRSSEMTRALQVLGESARGPAAERVAVAALAGLLSQRLHAQVLGVEPPPGVAGDDKLGRIYENEMNHTVAPWAAHAHSAFGACIAGAAAEREAVFGLWLALCQKRLGQLDEDVQQAAALAQAVLADREAERLALEGPRPAGPEICWQPNLGPEPPAKVAPEGAVGPPPRCALTPAEPPRENPVAVLETPGAPAATICADCSKDGDVAGGLMPRDLRYGARDAETGVRVSVALGDNPTMDARPLAGPGPQRALAACFARNLKPDKKVTVAFHANVSVDVRGHTRSVTVTPEPSDQAAPPSAALIRCLQAALRKTAFDCSPSGEPTQARATYCLRRD